MTMRRVKPLAEWPMLYHHKLQELLATASMSKAVRGQHGRIVLVTGPTRESLNARHVQWQWFRKSVYEHGPVPAELQGWDWHLARQPYTQRSGWMLVMWLEPEKLPLAEVVSLAV